MSAISTYLQRILNAIWARDVRQAIHDAISQCYDDVNAPALQTEAMQAAVQAKIDAGKMAALTIADGSLTGAKLTNGTIPTAKIADGAITTIKIADGAVTGAKVETGTLTGDNIANKAIGTTKIDDGAVTWQKLASGAVHTGELADSAVTNVKLADSSVSEGKLASGAVTSAKIANGAVTAEKIASGVIPAVDTTLTQANVPADAKAVGDAIADIELGLSDVAKTALLNCFQHVAWIDEHGQDYYDALESALYAEAYPRLTAVFNAGVNVIYTDDALDTLKQYLTVKYFATKESTGTVIASNDYTLSGTLTEGTSIITALYDDVRTAVSVPGVVDYYNIWHWSMANGDFSVRPGTIDYFGDESKVRYTFRTPYDTRRGVTAPKGLLPYRVWGTDTDMTSYYPIPIPKDANKVTISITPNTQYIYTHVMHVSDGNVTRIAQQGWTQGTTEVTFDKGENNAVSFNTKYDSAGSTYPTDPTEITIAFEEV